MSAHRCPHCSKPIPQALISQWHGEATGKLRATNAGWPKGKPRGAARPEQERCPCGSHTLKRALARGHKCEATPVTPPRCEECDVEMEKYFEALDTGRDGWRCPGCSWSFDV